MNPWNHAALQARDLYAAVRHYEYLLGCGSALYDCAAHKLARALYAELVRKIRDEAEAELAALRASEEAGDDRE